MKKMKFVIVSTRQKWGGAVALHALCMNLRNIGYDASIYYVNDGEAYKYPLLFWGKHFLFKIIDFYKVYCAKKEKEGYYSNNRSFSGYVDVPILGCPQKIIPHVCPNTVVIYPDIVYGNFLGAKKTVRWFLYYNRYDDTAYCKGDLFYAYRDIFNDPHLNPKKNILHMAYFNLDLYKRTNYGTRRGKCYVVRKGKVRKDLPTKFDGPIIDTYNEQMKVQIMNESKYCISYDTQTSYSTIAAICGCISIVVPEDGKTWQDYRSSDVERYGIAFGYTEEQLEWANETRSKAKERYLNINKEGIENTKKFVEDIKHYFKM